MQSQEDVKEEVDIERIEVDRLSNSKISQPPESIEKESDIDDEPSHISIRPEYSPQRLAEIAPKPHVIMAGNNHQQKLIDKYEVSMFEKLYKSMKYKYEDIIKILNLYSEVSFYSVTIYSE